MNGGSTRLRILAVNWQDWRNPFAGGAEVHLHEILKRLVARGHHVRMLVSGWAGAAHRETMDGIEVIRVGSRYSFPLHASRAFRSAGLAESTDVLVEDINKLPLFTPRWGVPVVAIIPHLFGSTAFQQESAPIASLVWAAERLMPAVYRDVPFLVISQSTADDLVGRGFSRDRITVSYPGVDHSVYRPADDAERFATPTAVYVGRLRKYKSLDHVLRAIARLADDGFEYHLRVAGTGDDRARLASLAAGLRIDDRVDFLGWIPEEDKVDLLRRAWVNVYPSPKEGWGITNIEAAACGTPSIASDAPGLRESVLDGVSGYLVPHGDVAAWAHRLRAIGEAPQLRDRLGAGGVDYAMDLTWDRTADEAEAFLIRSRDGSS